MVIDRRKFNGNCQLGETFGVTTGSSNYILGSTVPITAVTLGAKIVRKYFVLDKPTGAGGYGAGFSMDKVEFAQMAQVIRDVEKLSGKVDCSMARKKGKPRQFSRSLYVVKDIKKGEVFTEKNIRLVCPRYGVYPKHFKETTGFVTHTYVFGERVPVFFNLCSYDD